MSAELSQTDRVASFTTPMGKDFFVITKFEAEEGLSEIFEFRIEALCKTDNANLTSIMGEKCSVKFKLRDGSTRAFSGVLAEAQWVGGATEFQLYRFVLRPWLWLLSHRSDCRIFHDKTAPDIIKEIFGKEGKADFESRTSESYQTIKYCVQYRETDLRFVLRLMEQHGIYYYFKHSDDGHKLVMCDSKSGHETAKAAAGREAAGGAYAFLPRGGLDRRHVDHLVDWSAERRLRSGKVQLNDYDYKKSTADLKGKKEDGIPAAKKLELYDYPGKYIERSDGERFAEIKVQGEQALDERRYATGDAVSLYAGALMNLSGHTTPAEDGEYLVVRANHSFAAQAYRSSPSASEETYHGAYELQKSSRRFRAPQITQKPVIHGPQTAKVIGEKNKGKEGDIDVDDYGCILVHFHWDREDDTTSRRVRVAQVWSGNRWGGQFIPRIGQEAVVQFLEGDPDEPLVIGTVVNDKHMPPYEMPANKTQSGIKSESTDGGSAPGKYNEIKFEDQKDKEVFRMHAEKDKEVVVRNTESREIGEAFQGGAWSRKTTLKNGDDELHIDKGRLFVEAKTEIVLKVGMSTITMNPSSVTIDSPSVTIKSTETSITGDATVTIKGGMVTIN
jgi:type VI secretion system secreted protein VgrG